MKHVHREYISNMRITTIHEALVPTDLSSLLLGMHTNALMCDKSMQDVLPCDAGAAMP